MAKDPARKTNLENKYRLYKTQLDKTLKASKSIHYQKVFEINKLNLRITWEGIRQQRKQRQKRQQIRCRKLQTNITHIKYQQNN